MSILVSAGHSNIKGLDRGAEGNNFIEGVLAVELRDAVAAHLRDLGCQVMEDGFDGQNDPLKKAIALARNSKVSIELHWNAGPPAATGIEVLAKPKHRDLAQTIAQAIHDATGLVLRGDKGYQPDNVGPHHRLGFIEAGGLIVEVCFISNSYDMAQYRKNFEQVAKSIAGVLALVVT